MSVKNLAKSDIDLVADLHISSLQGMLEELCIKMYKRNPRELAKGQSRSIDQRIQQIFSVSADTTFQELSHKNSLEALRLVFDEEFKGDRVFALIVGLRSMLHLSYDSQEELFMLDSLDEQKLYNSARNIEIVAWRLANKRLANNELFLLTNAKEKGIQNLSFERLFGKLIQTQDMMANIMSQRNQRTINIIVQGIAKAVFLPVG